MEAEKKDIVSSEEKEEIRATLIKVFELKEKELRENNLSVETLEKELRGDKD